MRTKTAKVKLTGLIDRRKIDAIKALRNAAGRIDPPAANGGTSYITLKDAKTYVESVMAGNVCVVVLDYHLLHLLDAKFEYEILSHSTSLKLWELEYRVQGSLKIHRALVLAETRSKALDRITLLHATKRVDFLSTGEIEPPFEDGHILIET